MVDSRIEELERPPSHFPNSKVENGDRCLPVRLRSSSRLCPHSGSVVRIGEETTYQPPRIDGGHLCNPILRSDVPRMDNKAAICYINHMGGTRSLPLSHSACQLW